MAALVAQYDWLLDSVLSTRPQWQGCLSRCRHCAIRFIADPRNAGRDDLGCPFGCKEAHRKAAAALRSLEYYRSPEGKEKKRRQNRKRCLVAARGPEAFVAAEQEARAEAAHRGEVDEAEVAAEVEPEPEPEPEPEGEPGEPSAAQSPPGSHEVGQVAARWSELLLEYLRLLSSMIEGRRVNRREVLEMLGEIVRQRSMARKRKLDKIVERLHQQPP